MNNSFNRTIPLIAATLAAVNLTTATAGRAESVARPHWIPNAMELQDELRQAGYVVVWGEGDACQARTLPEYKVVVVCGENPIGDLRQAAWEVRTGNFTF